MDTCRTSGHLISRGAAARMQNFDERGALIGLRDLDAQVIGAVYDRYFPELFRYARYRLNDDHLAEDIASDVFVRLLEAARSGRGPQTNLKAWLLGTASHAVTDHLRRSYRRPTAILSEDLQDAGPQPDGEFDRRESRRSFQQAYAGLTSEQQHVLALRFGQGYSLEETAMMLRKKVNAVKALQFRALAALQRQYQEVAGE